MREADFPLDVKRTLCQRVGNRCAKPDCRALTSGPQSDTSKSLNIGVASHIAAASPGGPRYDSSMTPQARQSIENGIWLCQNCAKLVDNDEKRYTVAVLNYWKEKAEAEALRSIGKRIGTNEEPQVDISVMNRDSSGWHRGAETVLDYSLHVSEEPHIKIDHGMEYINLFKKGGPISPLDYLTPTGCAFEWGFPVIDLKVLNNSESSLFFTGANFDVKESVADEWPLFVIRKDKQRAFAGELYLVNEGCDLSDVSIAFELVPGESSLESPSSEPDLRHLLSVPLLQDFARIDVTSAFKAEGVDIDGLISLSNSRREDTLLVQSAGGLVEQIGGAEAEARWKQCLGRFQEEVGTLAGEISFRSVLGTQIVKFKASVYLSNLNRRGLFKPPSYNYEAFFEIPKAQYQRKVAISQALQPRDADRFTFTVGVAQTSLHRFAVELVELSGRNWRSLPVQMKCFVPRSRRKLIEEKFRRNAGVQ
jgi:hypothetical protein